MLQLVLLLVVVAVAGAIGRRSLRWLRIEFTSVGEELVFSSALGLIEFAYLIMLAGFVGLLYRWFAYALLAATAVAFYRDLLHILKCAATLVARTKRIRQHSAFDRLLMLVLAAMVLVSLIGALAPPSAYDELSYHLVFPKVYAEAHRFCRYPSVTWGFPQITEMMYLLGMLVGGDIVAKLIHFAFYLLMLGAVAAFARRYFGSNRFGLFAATILSSMTMVGWLATTAYVDLALGCYSFLSVYALANAVIGKEANWAPVAGLMWGAAMGVKYSGLLMPGVFVVGMLIYLSLKTVGRLRMRAARVVVPILLAFMLIAPWLARNVVYVGNPVYPFMGEVFNTAGPAGVGSWMEDSKLRIAVEAGLLDNLLLPWTLTLNEEFDPGGHRKIGIGPLLLMFLPALIWVRPRHRAASFLLIYVLATFIIWVLVMQHDLRYLLPIFAALAVAASYAVVRMSESGTAVRTVVRCAFLLAMLYPNLSVSGARFVEQVRVVSHLKSREDYLLGAFDGYAAQVYANDMIPRGAKLITSDVRTYYLDPQPTLRGQWAVYGLNLFDHSGDIIGRIRQGGFSYLLTSERSLRKVEARYPTIGTALTRELASRDIEIVFSQNGWHLYSVDGIAREGQER